MKSFSRNAIGSLVFWKACERTLKSSFHLSLTAVRKQGFHNPNRFSREPCEYILTFLSQALQFLTLFKKTRRALFTPCTSFVLFQCIELSKTNLLLSCPSILITTRSSAALLAAQNHSVKPSCCITT